MGLDDDKYDRWFNNDSEEPSFGQDDNPAPAGAILTRSNINPLCCVPPPEKKDERLTLELFEIKTRIETLEQRREFQGSKYFAFKLLVDGEYVHIGFWNFMLLMLIPMCLVSFICLTIVYVTLAFMGIL